MLLEPMLSRLASADTLDGKIQAGLQDLIALHGAEMGNVQLPGADGQLLIVAASGLSGSFLKTFERVAVGSGTVCGRAARVGKPVFVPDVTVDDDFRHYREFAASVPFKSVLSCPLTSSAGELVGMISVHSANRFVPTPLELRAAETYGRHLADAIVELAPAPDLASYAERCSARLLAEANSRARSRRPT
jgi:GAF domain-containing protein